jgi:hypothetical protein
MAGRPFAGAIAQVEAGTAPELALCRMTVDRCTARAGADSPTAAAHCRVTLPGERAAAEATTGWLAAPETIGFRPDRSVGPAATGKAATVGWAWAPEMADNSIDRAAADKCRQTFLPGGPDKTPPFRHSG